ncbi:DMP19 family protein [Chitinophaga sp.]|uniref:DMP19 family protein n=1 Tax=Chitinophaga sp. TaxID=1869181 RepID=UPI002BEE7F93|nr:hypothetical protein [Chitinophaga sp.]HWV67609.1 hypothetical protein [Chitinophaga sp.]
MQENCDILLSELNDQIRNAIKSGTHTTDYPQAVQFVLLADLFNYHVVQGGFAQLIYNLQGAYLAEIEAMLLAADATTAHLYYVQSIEKCLEEDAHYQQFLESPYTDEHTLKNELHVISIAYFKTGKSFIAEICPFISSSAAAVNGWLANDIN